MLWKDLGHSGCIQFLMHFIGNKLAAILFNLKAIMEDMIRFLIAKSQDVRFHS